ncbi:MAG: hypothetical protein QXM93_03070 [Candidatus Methanomethyliaceae archaeon]
MSFWHDFAYWGDFSNIGNLHVYGDLLNLYNLKLETTVAKAGALYNEIANIERRLLTVYISYILAHKGYYVKTPTGEDFAEIEGKKLYTTRFADKDWIENFDLFEPRELDLGFTWVEDYENERGEKIRIVFVTLLLKEINIETGKELDEVQVLIKEFDKNSTNFVIVHPALPRRNKRIFLEAKEKMRERTCQDLLLSTGEFTSKIIPNDIERHVVEQNWASLRDNILEQLQKEWPILVFATQKQQFEVAEERIYKAKVKHEAKEFEEAIMNAGVCCESLLQIYYSMYYSKKLYKNEFYDLLCTLKDIITEKFGECIYNDLDFIREWRNKVVHPSPEKPSEIDSLQILRKAELFYELFKKEMLMSHESPMPIKWHRTR